MVKTQNDLEQEIDELILLGLDAEQTMPAKWIVQAVLEKHPEVRGADRDFYVLCAFSHVRNTVRTQLRWYKEAPEKIDEQLILPGYERLQKGYLVHREGEQTIVPISQMKNEEMQAKISELRKMAEGCQQHADELERWRQEHFEA